MSHFKKILNQWRFLKNNSLPIIELITLRLKIISFDVISLQQNFMYALILIGIALIFFLFAILGLFFGLTQLITNPFYKLWLFFGGSFCAIFVFVLMIVWASKKIKTSLAALINSIQDLNQELNLVSGKVNTDDILHRLKQNNQKELEELFHEK